MARYKRSHLNSILGYDELLVLGTLCFTEVLDQHNDMSDRGPSLIHFYGTVDLKLSRISLKSVNTQQSTLATGH